MKRHEEWELLGEFGEKVVALVAKYQELKLSLVHRDLQRMADDTEKTITWDKEKVKAFRKAWTAAEKAEKESFEFEGQEVLVSYGRYLLEYLEHVFGEAA